MYSNLINLGEFFEGVDDYVVLRLSEDFPNYYDYSDIDILCKNRDNFLAHILRVGEKYRKQGFQVKVYPTKSGHIHVDFYPPGASKLNLSFDLLDCFSYKKSSLDHNAVLSSRKQKIQGGVTILVPDSVYELVTRFLEYYEYKDSRPDKIKHWRYIKKHHSFPVFGLLIGVEDE